MTAPTVPAEYHHHNMADHLTIDHYPNNDPSLGVVIVRDEQGAQHAENVTELEAWT